MNKLLILLALVVSTTFCANAQKKSELISDNQQLKFQLDSVKRIVSNAKQGEKIELLKATALQEQVVELQAANATLLGNLNNFAALSSQNSENINKTLLTLEKKEAQLKGLVSGFAGNDSTALVILTDAKRTLGENAKVQTSNGEIVIVEKLDFFFADELRSTPLETANTRLVQIATLLNAHPKMKVTVTGMTITGEFGTALIQAATIAALLITDYGVDGDSIFVKSADGGFTESIQFSVHQDYKDFYSKAKEDMKN